MAIQFSESFCKSYKPTSKEVWTGRIDSTTDYEAFRWHQVVEVVDLLDSQAFVSYNPNETGFCFIGFRCDKGVERNKGRVGTSKGPLFIRKEMANLPCAFPKQIKLFDAGNIFPAENDSLEDAQKNLSIAIQFVLDKGLFPLVMGGGHEIAFGHYLGIINSQKFSPEVHRLGIVNFDAHFDMRPYQENGASSGTMFRQIADLCQENNRHYGYFCLGIQQTGNTVSLFKKADELGVQYVLARDISDFSLLDIFDKLDRFIQKHDHLYVTICSDVFSSAFAPGVSASQPFGLHPEILLKILKHILKSRKVCTFDIAEVSPRFDHDNQTARLAAIILFSIINTLVRLKE